MSETKWTVKPDGPDFLIMNGPLIVEARVYDRDAARLIAAAPEMAEALRFYRDAWFQNADGDLSYAHLTRTWMEPTDKLMEDAGRKAADVLAKIEGRQP